MCFTKCLVTNHFMDLRGGRLGWEYNDGLSRVFSHSAEKIRRGSSLFFRFSLVSKNVRDKKRGGYHELPSKLLSHSTKSFRRGILLCFRKFRLSKNFMTGKGIPRLSNESFWSHSAELFRR